MRQAVLPLPAGLVAGSSIAVLEVLTWRLFNDWLPLWMGGGAQLLAVPALQHDPGVTDLSNQRSGRGT
jgi:hypothetical protein